MRLQRQWGVKRLSLISALCVLYSCFVLLVPASICTFVLAVPAHCLRLQLISVSFLFVCQYLYFCTSSAFALRTTYASSFVSAFVRTNEKKMCQYLYFCIFVLVVPAHYLIATKG